MSQESRSQYTSQSTASFASRRDEFSSEFSKGLHICELEREWRENLVSGVDFGRMLTELLHDPPQESQTFSLSLPGASSQLPDMGYFQAFAHAANSILFQYYSKYPPTAHKPAILFLPTSEAIFSDYEPEPEILVVLRDEWERTKQSMVSNGLGHVHQNPQSDRGVHSATEVRFPWEIVVAVIEFGLDKVRAPLSPLESPCDDCGRKRPRSSTENTPLLWLPKIRRVGSPSRLTPSPEKHDEHACLADSSPRIRVDEDHLQSRTWPAPEVRLLGCFHQLLNGGTYRGWVSGAIVEGQKISLVSCDRGGLVQSSLVDMRSPEGFKLLYDWILTLGSGSMEQWGYTDIFGSTGKPAQETEFDVPATNLHLSFGRLRYQQRDIFGRCTNVYDVTIRTPETDIDGVCKISWPLSSRPNEHKLLEKAHTVDPIHTPAVHCAWDVVMELPSKRLGSHCGGASAVKQRTLRITVMTRYQPIDNLGGADFLTAFIQIMKCNVLLYESGCVHHRDLSPGNMMYSRDEGGQIIGVLTDFDLAIPLDEPDMQDHDPQSLHGTAPFMPVDFQFGYEGKHTLQHDFESAFYILVWVALGYKDGKPPSGKEDRLILWRNRSWRQIAFAKQRFVSEPTNYLETGDLVRPGYQGLLEPIEKLRGLIALRTFARPFQLLGIPEMLKLAPPLAPSQFFECFGLK